MRKTVFRAEVGTLLYPGDEEFDFYSKVYDEKYGYYDTNVGYYFTLSDAKAFIMGEIEHSGCTYGVITSDIMNLTDDQISAIENQDYADDWYAWSEKDIVYRTTKERV